ncbi:MAG: tRNA 4-thiouridine(8) synthase ThiI [Clostridiales bacterium]|nr:tRNA 4-thiouridine(8) synthase ThiI [Clostridiales bacterium]
MKKALLVKYGEIFLRGANRGFFERRLAKMIKRRLSGFDVRVTRENGRFLVESDSGDMDYNHIIPAVSKIFGLIGLSPCVMTEDQSIENLCKISADFIRTHYGQRTFSFKVKTRRADKRYPLNSQEISAIVGEKILGDTQSARVDLHNPEVTLHIELRKNAYIYAETVKTHGGLPYGSSGRGALLLSGGIDSPVAGYMMAKRGVELIPVYFHSPPYTSERAKEKVLDLTRVLTGFTGNIKLYVIPFTDVQLCIHRQCQPEKLTILLKRAMLKIAALIAARENCHCLITGDSVGQVASQTMQSLAAAQSAVSLPILRPLAGLDKQEIIDIAAKIGTFDISIRPYEDCCTIFIPAHPETKPKIHAIDNAERHLEGLEELILIAAEQAEIIII